MRLPGAPARIWAAPVADLIVVIADGRVAEAGDHATLLAVGGLYAELFQPQARAYR